VRKIGGGGWEKKQLRLDVSCAMRRDFQVYLTKFHATGRQSERENTQIMRVRDRKMQTKQERAKMRQKARDRAREKASNSESKRLRDYSRFSALSLLVSVGNFKRIV